MTHQIRCVTRGGRERGLPCPFSKIEKMCPDFGGGGNALIVAIYGFKFVI